MALPRPSADYYNSPPGELPLWGREKTKKSHRFLLQKAATAKPKLGLVREAGCHSTHPRSRGASGLDSERHRRLFVESKELRLVDKPSSLRKRSYSHKAGFDKSGDESTVLRNIKSWSSIFGGTRYQEAPRRLCLEVRAKSSVWGSNSMFARSDQVRLYHSAGDVSGIFRPPKTSLHASGDSVER